MWSLVKRALFSMDAERAHRLAVSAMRVGLGVPSGELPAGSFYENLGLGMTFRSRVGLAAGFDKDAELVGVLPRFGFGFVEVGTVTPRPQPGNPRPRLFRDPARRALFNRMGFNSAGAAAVSKNLALARDLGLPSDFRVGVNIGKNKETSADEAHRDYAAAVTPFLGLVDFVVINVSSPNTPGLRSLQTAESLRPIVEAVNDALSGRRRGDLGRPPLLLKLAPELNEEALSSLIPSTESWGIDGWVLTNTLEGEGPDGSRGGWSGSPLTEHSRLALSRVRGMTQKPIVSVGGIGDAEEARARIQAGADLVEIYSGWIYGGPAFPARVARSLALP